MKLRFALGFILLAGIVGGLWLVGDRLRVGEQPQATVTPGAETQGMAQPVEAAPPATGSEALDVPPSVSARSEAEPPELVSASPATLPLAEVRGRVVYRDGAPVVDEHVQLLQPAAVDDSRDSPILDMGVMTSGNTSHVRRRIDVAVTDEQGRFRFALADTGSYVLHATVDGSAACSQVFEVTDSSVNEIDLVIVRGGLLRGTLRDRNGNALGGFRVAVEYEAPEGVDDISWEIRSLLTSHRTVAKVGSAGHFELGPLSAGSVTVYCLPPNRSFGGRWANADMGSNRLELCRLEIEEERVIERDLVAPELPGTVVLRVTVNGEPAAGFDVELEGEEWSDRYVSGVTEEDGTFGPVLALAGVWTVTVCDREQRWRSTSPVLLQVAPSTESRFEVPVEVTTAKVLFIDLKGRQPLAGRPVAAFASDIPLRIGDLQETDIDGAASFALPPGEYRFVLDPGDAPVLRKDAANRVATLTWTPSGPVPSHADL